MEVVEEEFLVVLVVFGSVLDGYWSRYVEPYTI